MAVRHDVQNNRIQNNSYFHYTSLWSFSGFTYTFAVMCYVSRLIIQIIVKTYYYFTGLKHVPALPDHELVGSISFTFSHFSCCLMCSVSSGQDKQLINYSSFSCCHIVPAGFCRLVAQYRRGLVVLAAVLWLLPAFNNTITG